jgi:hypothetical protein
VIQNITSKLTFRVAAAALMLFGGTLLGQKQVDLGEIHGNFEIDAQTYKADSLIGAPDFPEKIGNNSFMNLLYTRGKFEAGVRFENYYPSLQGFTRERGAGIPYRYARYRNEKFDVTAGTFYEQFGSGMVLRAYEAWGLGFDNSLDGVRVKSEPVKGVYLTGLIGRQRNAYSNKVENLSEGIVRGFDAEWSINDSFDSLMTAKTRVKIGGSFVSRFQKDEDPVQIIPENVASFAGRASVNRSGLNLSAEYAYKFNDPSTVNNLIYKNGTGVLVQASYARKGLGISAQVKRIDNMDFRSDRNGTFNNLTLNFLPPQTRQHSYRLPTLFPWATQPLGEWGMQAEIGYNFKKDTWLGGKYGMNLSVNWSRINALSKTPTLDPFDGYTSPFFPLMDSVLFQDINIELTKKFSPKFKATLSYLHFDYDQSLFHQLTGFNSSKDVSAEVQVLDMSYKLAKKHTLRMEFQHCYTKQEFGSWAMVLAEYTIAPHFFIAVFDEYNYGNAEKNKRLHYFSGLGGVNWNNYRFQIGYGRQRAGVLCVGGVCRVVPASNGISLAITGSF